MKGKKPLLAKFNMTQTLIVILFTGVVIPCASFPYVYYFVSESKTWQDAQTYCVSQYTALAQINNMENLTTMMSTSPSGYTGKAWIGLTAAWNWAWEDGQLATYVHWMPGQPDNANGEFCATILSGLWTDASCSQTKSSICFDGTNIVVGSPMTWINADAYCKSQASSLAVILDDATNTKIWIKMGFTFTLEAWIGLRKTQTWQWSDTSENDTFRNWEPGRPDNLQGQNCAAVAVGTGSWTDEQCLNQYPFFCYDIYKSWSIVVRMTIQSTANVEDPATSDDLLQQLHVMFANNGVTNLKLTWQDVHQTQERPTSRDPLCLWTL